MNLYAESSAVLAWLLRERVSADVVRHLGEAPLILASDLTLIECDRALIRATATGSLPEGNASQIRSRLVTASAHWHLMPVGPEIVERSRRPFPAEPFRTLDAIHLASALLASASVPDLALLSLDKRLRSAAQAMGMSTVPE